MHQSQSLWPSGIGSHLGRNRLRVRFLAVSDIYPMFIDIEPTITWDPSGSLGTYGLTQKLCKKSAQFVCDTSFEANVDRVVFLSHDHEDVDRQQTSPQHQGHSAAGSERTLAIQREQQYIYSQIMNVTTLGCAQTILIGRSTNAPTPYTPSFRNKLLTSLQKLFLNHCRFDGLRVFKSTPYLQQIIDL